MRSRPVQLAHSRQMTASSSGAGHKRKEKGGPPAAACGDLRLDAMAALYLHAERLLAGIALPSERLARWTTIWHAVARQIRGGPTCSVK